MLGNIFQPFTSMQELNLDWILTKIKIMLRFLPDDGAVGQILRRTAHGAEWSDEQGAGGSVTSVNGMQGAVVLDASDVGALPDTYTSPVDSVNGQTGTVVLDASDVGALPNTYTAPVDSVNGQTGTVVLDASDVGALPNTYTAPVDSVNGQTGTVVLDASDVGALPDTYVAPVTSVNGHTGAVLIATPFADYGTSVKNINTYNATWTATDDCIFIAAMGGASGTPAACFIDGAQVALGAIPSGTYGVSYPNNAIGYIQRGQVFTTRNNSNTVYNVNFYKLKNV